MSHATAESQLLRTPEQPKRAKQIVVEASPFTLFTKQLPDITPPRSTAATSFLPFSSPFFSPHVVLPSPSFGLGIGYPEQYIRELGASDDLAETETRFDRSDVDTEKDQASTSFADPFDKFPSPSLIFSSPKSSPDFDSRPNLLSSSVPLSNAWVMSEPRYGSAEGQLSSSWPNLLTNQWQMSRSNGYRVAQENRRLAGAQQDVYFPGSGAETGRCSGATHQPDQPFTILQEKGRLPKLGPVRSARRKLITTSCSESTELLNNVESNNASSFNNRSSKLLVSQGNTDVQRQMDDLMTYRIPSDKSYSQQKQMPLTKQNSEFSDKIIPVHKTLRSYTSSHLLGAFYGEDELDDDEWDSDTAPPPPPKTRSVPNSQTKNKSGKKKLILKTGERKIHSTKKNKGAGEKSAGNDSPHKAGQAGKKQLSVKQQKAQDRGWTIGTGSYSQFDKQELSCTYDSGSSPQSCGVKRMRSPMTSDTSNPAVTAALQSTSSDFCSQFARAAGLAAAAASRVGKRPGLRRAESHPVSPDSMAVEDAECPPPDDGPRKCSCKRSKCLKLYCDCFAVGQFCNESCGCVGCENTADNREIVDERRDQIKQRNPQAFEGKIQRVGDITKAHVRGCNCKKSHCRKKYCECFQAGIPCGESCRCEGCHNCAADVISADAIED